METTGDLYVFGDKDMIPDLQDAAIDLLIDQGATSRIIPVSIFGHVYQNIKANSQLCKLCVNWSVHVIQPRE